MSVNCGQVYAYSFTDKHWRLLEDEPVTVLVEGVSTTIFSINKLFKQEIVVL